MHSHRLPKGNTARSGAFRPAAAPMVGGVAGDGHPATPTVALVKWPEEGHLIETLARLGMPRLLLVAPDAEPPVVEDLEEDWLRLPAAERDIQARMATLRRRCGLGDVPVLDGACRLCFRGAWAPLSPLEYSIATLLVERFGRLVGDDDLMARAWTGAPPGGATLRVHLTRLRRRIAPVGLEIRTVRSRGHVMQPVGAKGGLSGFRPDVASAAGH